MKRILGVSTRDGTTKQVTTSSVQFERRAADVFRQIQKLGGYKTPTDLLDAMMLSFCHHEMRNIEVQFGEDDKAASKKRRARR